MPQRTIRVLHVISSLDAKAGGTTAALLALAVAHRDVGMEVSVISTFAAGHDESAAGHLRSHGVHVTLIGPHERFLARHPQIKPELNRLIAAHDIVHIHALWEEIQHQAAAIARKLNKPYAFTPHGMLDPWSLSQSKLKKRIYLALRLKNDLDRAAFIHFTDETERDLTRDLKLQAPSVVERLIIDLDDFRPPPPTGEFRARFADKVGARPIVLFMSRIHRKKGLDLLIPAFAQAAAGNDAMLVIAGPDAEGYQAEVEAMVRQHGIAERVLFPGMLRGRDRAAAIVDADLFVLPSYQENFGVVVIESLAAGTPVIISDQVNIHRQISQARVGAVVPTKVEPLANALREWLSNASLRAEASRRASEFVGANYDRDVLAKRWVDIYRRFVPSS